MSDLHRSGGEQRYTACHSLDRTDSSGIRFYVGRDLRQYDIGYLSLGAEATVLGIAIPPRVDRFIIDSYCPANLMKVSNQLLLMPITVTSAFREFRKQVSPWSPRFLTRIYKVSRT